MDWSINEAAMPGRVTVALIGDFDLYEGPRFATAMSARIRAGCADLVLDLSAVEYLDSCGVGVLIKLLQLMRQTGGKLRLKGLHGTPRKVLQMFNVLSLLQEIDVMQGAT